VKQQTLAIVANTACLGLTLWAPGGDGAAQEKKRMAKEQRAKEAAKAIELGELPPPKKIPKVRATLPSRCEWLAAGAQPSVNPPTRRPMLSLYSCRLTLGLRDGVCPPMRPCCDAATRRHRLAAWDTRLRGGCC